MSRILLTGGGGFIGSHIALSLLEAGHNLVILDNLVNSSRSVLDSIKSITHKEPVFIEGDVTDIKQLRDIFGNDKQPIDAVIHLAALKSVAESLDMPMRYYQINIGGLLELMRAMQEYDCYNLIFSSSATIYGQATQLPITEQDKIAPTNPYGISKATSEYILQNTCANEPNWNIISLRYFNPAGCHPSALLGEDIEGNSQNLFVAIARSYLVPNYQLKVFGADYATKDGTCVRDYVHVSDLADAHLLAMNKTLSHAHNGYVAINIGSGIGYSVLEVINAFQKLDPKPIARQITEARPGDVAASYTSIHLAKSLLNWQPQADLKTICQDTLRYINNNKKKRHSPPQTP